MAFSTQRAVSDGTLVQLSLSIGYFYRSDIEVYFAGVISPLASGKWSWVGTTDTKINFSPAVSNGVEVLVKRSTALDYPRHLYTQGAQFVAETLDDNFLQMLRIAQEAKEGSTLSEIFNDLDIHGFKIKNLGAATLPGDAISLAQYQADANGAYAQNQSAIASAAAALASKNAASTSAAAALVSQNAAATSATAQVALATTQAGNAATSATLATAQVALAVTASTAAQTAQTAAELALDSFDDRYLGAKATAPTLDNDGQALLVGAMYFDTAIASGVLRLYNGTAWLTIPGALTGSASQDFLAKDITVSSQNGGQLAGFRNRIINGDMRVDQRGAGTVVLNLANTNSFCLDRYGINVGGAIPASRLSFQQVVDAPAGFSNSLKVTVVTAYTPAAGDQLRLTQAVEATSVFDFAWGSSAAKPVVLSFWAKATVPGSYSLGLLGYGMPYSYLTSVTLTTAWAMYSVQVPAQTSGAWNSGNTGYLYLQFDIGCGSNLVGAAGWSASGSPSKVASSVTLVSQSAGSSLNITGIQLEVGQVASVFEQRPYGVELMLCQRYYTNSWSPYAQTPGNAGETGAVFNSYASSYAFIPVRFPVQMRTIPSAIPYSTDGTAYNARNWGAGTNIAGYVCEALHPGSMRLSCGAGGVPIGITVIAHYSATSEL